MYSFPCLPVQSSGGDDTKRDMNLPDQMTRLEVVGGDTEDYLDEEEDEYE